MGIRAGFAQYASTITYTVALGPYPRLSLSQARDAARKLMNDARSGIFQEQGRDDARLTLADAIPQFIDLYAKPKNRNWRQQNAF